MNYSIILASGSAARRNMLLSAGVKFDTKPADLDELSIIDQLQAQGESVAIIAKKLAYEKALSVSTLFPQALVIGSDQTLEVEKKLMSKSSSLPQAIEKLKELRGRAHLLHSSVCVVRDGQALFEHTDTARMVMHDFDDDFLDLYAVRDSDALLSCVGGYKIEGMGAWLFERVEGDHYTIMGMPLLPLLTFLRTECGVLP